MKQETTGASSHDNLTSDRSKFPLVLAFVRHSRSNPKFYLKQLYGSHSNSEIAGVYRGHNPIV